MTPSLWSRRTPTGRRPVRTNVALAASSSTTVRADRRLDQRQHGQMQRGQRRLTQVCSLEAQRILPLAELVAGHDQGSLAAARTILSAWSADSRAARAVRTWLNDLRWLHGDLFWVHGQLLALHVDRAEAAVSAVTTAMIANQQERGRDRRIRPLPPDAHLALDAYLHERIALMDRVLALLDDLDPPPRLRRWGAAI